MALSGFAGGTRFREPERSYVVASFHGQAHNEP